MTDIPEDDGLGSDLLEGGDEIAHFLFGPGKRRKFYHKAETGRLPVFKIGSTWCARRTVLRAWIAEQESNTLERGKKKNRR